MQAREYSSSMTDLVHLLCSTGLQPLGLGMLQGPTVACNQEKKGKCLIIHCMKKSNHIWYINLTNGKRKSMAWLSLTYHPISSSLLAAS